MTAIYLDNNATTRLDPQVLDSMLPFLREHFANASSLHGAGAVAAEALRQARGQIRALLGAAHDQEILFTSGGTESDNAAILSALATQAGRDEIVTTAVEHPAILSLVGHLEKDRGVTVHRIGVDGQGRLDVAAYRRALGPRTAIASVMWANNETGTVFPVPLLAEQAHQAGALFHTDAVQAAGRVAIDLADSAVDMLSLSAHKLHGPKGVGALYLRKGVPFQPLLRGGRQERGRRAGTENLPAIVGFGMAAALAAARLPADSARLARWRDRLEDAVMVRIGHCRINGDPANRLPNTSNIAFDGLDGEAIVHHLDQFGVAASIGSACASGSMEPSHVLRAMKLPPTALHGALRLSLGRDNDDEQIDRAVDALARAVSLVRDRSPAWRTARSA